MEEVLTVVLSSLLVLLLSAGSLDGVRARKEKVERGEEGADDKPTINCRGKMRGVRRG